MDIQARKMTAYFYRSEQGVEPVREWLRSLPKEDKKVIGEDMRTVQFGWPLGMPLVGSVGHGLWEVRVSLSGGRIARIIFFIHDTVMVMVNGFIKKTQKLPRHELELAIKRKKIYIVNSTETGE